MLTALWAWLSPKLISNAFAIGKWILIALIILAAIFGIKRYGRLEQKVKDYEVGIKVVQRRSQIEREMRRASDPELDRWL